MINTSQCQLRCRLRATATGPWLGFGTSMDMASAAVSIASRQLESDHGHCLTAVRELGPGLGSARNTLNLELRLQCSPGSGALPPRSGAVPPRSGAVPPRSGAVPAIG